MKFSYGALIILGATVNWIGITQSAPDLSVDAPSAPRRNGNCSDWTAWMPPRTDPAVIMQVVTEGYIPVEENFIKLMEENSRFSRDNIYLMCLDEYSERAIELMGFRCVPVIDHLNNRNVKSVWRLRVKVLACLLEAGYDVITSDSDALWLKDPAVDFDLPEVRGSSIVASRGNMPREIVRRWKSTLCMGFVLFRAGPGMDIFLDNMERLAIKIGDDQKALNFALNELKVDWDRTTDMRFISTDFGRGTVAEIGINVTLLPHNQYTRFCDKAPIGPNTTVAHCHAPKQGALKMAWMQEKGLWEYYDVSGEEGEGETQGASRSEEYYSGPGT